MVDANTVLLFLPMSQAEYNQTDHVRVCQSKSTLQLRALSKVFSENAHEGTIWWAVCRENYGATQIQLGVVIV